MPDIITTISNSLGTFFEINLFGIPLWLILILFGLFCYWLYKRTPKEEKYKEINLEKEVKKDVKNLFDISSLKMKGFKGNVLRIGYNIIGNVKEVIRYNWSKDLKTLNPLIKLKKEIKDDQEPYIFYGFYVVNKGLKGSFQLLFGRGKYFLVDNNLVELKNKEIIINPNSQFTKFLGVEIFSQKGSDVITDIAFKKTLEASLKEQVNFIPKMSFLETKQASRIAKYRELTKLEQEKYAKGLEKLVEED